MADISWTDPLSMLSDLGKLAGPDTYNVASGAKKAGLSSDVGAGNTASTKSLPDQAIDAVRSGWKTLLLLLVVLFVAYVALRWAKVI